MAYTYVYMDPELHGQYNYGEYVFEYQPYYIGKGNGDRYLSHLKKAKNNSKNLPVLDKIRSLINRGYSEKTLKNFIIKIEDNISDSDALFLEKSLIDLIGRRILDTGPLMNILDGGEYQKSPLQGPMTGKCLYNVWIEKYGVNIANEKMCDYKKLMSEISTNKIFSESTKKKMSESAKKSWEIENRRELMSESTKKYWDILTAKEHDDRTKNMGKSFLGKKHTEETKSKWSSDRKGSKNHRSKSISIDGKIFNTITECSKSLGIHKNTLKKRLNSDVYPGWNWI